MIRTLGLRIIYGSFMYRYGKFTEGIFVASKALPEPSLPGQRGSTCGVWAWLGAQGALWGDLDADVGSQSQPPAPREALRAALRGFPTHTWLTRAVGEERDCMNRSGRLKLICF